MPPLRERADDVLLLTRTFLAQLGRRHGRTPLELPEETRTALLEHPWRGNVRELENVIQRALVLHVDGCITAADIVLDTGRSLQMRPAWLDQRAMPFGLKEGAAWVASAGSSFRSIKPT